MQEWRWPSTVLRRQPRHLWSWKSCSARRGNFWTGSWTTLCPSMTPQTVSFLAWSGGSSCHPASPPAHGILCPTPETPSWGDRNGGLIGRTPGWQLWRKVPNAPCLGTAGVGGGPGTGRVTWGSHGPGMQKGTQAGSTPAGSSRQGEWDWAACGCLPGPKTVPTSQSWPAPPESW